MPKEDNKVAMVALQQEFQGKLAQEIVVRERLSEELVSAKRQLAAAASTCQEKNRCGGWEGYSFFKHQLRP